MPLLIGNTDQMIRKSDDQKIECLRDHPILSSSHSLIGIWAPYRAVRCSHFVPAAAIAAAVASCGRLLARMAATLPLQWAAAPIPGAGSIHCQLIAALSFRPPGRDRVRHSGLDPESRKSLIAPVTPRSRPGGRKDVIRTSY